MADAPTADPRLDAAGLAKYLARKIFACGDDPGRLATRIEYKSGPIGAERSQGGFVEPAFAGFIERLLRELPPELVPAPPPAGNPSSKPGAVEYALRQGDRCRNYGPERVENEDVIVILADEVERLQQRVVELERSLAEEVRDHWRTKRQVRTAPPPAAPPAYDRDKYPTACLAVEGFIEEYVDSYEMVGEDEEGREGHYTPDSDEDALIRDAIAGLHGDEDFVSLIGAEYLERQARRAAEGACLGCGAPAGQHWGKCSAVETTAPPWISWEMQEPPDEQHHPGDTVSIELQVKGADGVEDIARYHYPTRRWCRFEAGQEFQVTHWRRLPVSEEPRR